MNFTVKYSQEKDILVYLSAIWKPTWVDYGKSRYETSLKYYPKYFIDNLKNAASKQKALKIIKDYWSNTRPSIFSRNTKLITKWFNRFFAEECHLIIDRLEKAYKKPFPFDKITIYLTTFSSCPYSYQDKWFMVNRNANLMTLLSISTHELNHFMYYYYFEGYVKKRGLSDTQSEHLKEALAILTSENSNENEEKTNVIPIQNFIRQNRQKPINEIIDLVINSKLLDSIK